MVYLENYKDSRNNTEKLTMKRKAVQMGDGSIINAIIIAIRDLAQPKVSEVSPVPKNVRIDGKTCLTRISHNQVENDVFHGMRGVRGMECRVASLKRLRRAGMRVFSRLFAGGTANR